MYFQFWNFIQFIIIIFFLTEAVETFIARSISWKATKLGTEIDDDMRKKNPWKKKKVPKVVDRVKFGASLFIANETLYKKYIKLDNIKSWFM